MPIKVYNGSQWVQVSDGTDGASGVTTVKQYTDSDYTVERSGSSPIIITDSGETVGIGSTSNAYGARYIQSTTPTSSIDGDIWYNVGAGGTTASPRLKHGGSWLNILNSASLSTYTFDFTTLGASQTWTKPTTGVLAFIFVWGGGGSGSGAHHGNGDAGGGGGGCAFGIFPLSDLTATVSLVVGKGGSAPGSDNSGNDGTDSTFGSDTDSFYLKGNGGEGGQKNNRGGYGGDIFGNTHNSIIQNGGFAGGAGSYGSDTPGKSSMFGGGGGGGGWMTINPGPAGGFSAIGGNGGAGGGKDSGVNAVDGSVPGGGGGGRSGNNSGGIAAGGNGQIKIYII